jgi:hypothetical protein
MQFYVLAIGYWATVAKRKARMSTQSLLIIIVVVVVYKINCMQKRINVATRYGFKIRTSSTRPCSRAST